MPVSKHFWLAIMVVILLCWLLGCASSHAAGFDPKDWDEIASNDQGQSFALSKKVPIEYDKDHNIIRAFILTADRTDRETPFTIRENMVYCSQKQFIIISEESFGPYGTFVQKITNRKRPSDFAKGSLLDNLCIGVRSTVTRKLI